MTPEVARWSPSSARGCARDASGYAEDAAAISELARTMPGYVEHKAFVADDGERVTLVTFADRASSFPRA